MPDEVGVASQKRRPKLPPRPRSAFADLVTKILEDRGLSLQQAARDCGGEVSFGTIRSMCQGIVPNNIELVMIFAEKMHVDANALLDAAGKPHVRYVAEARRRDDRVRRALALGLRPA